MADTEDIAISVQHVNKTFKLPHEKNSSIKGALVNFRKHKKGYEKQHVLKDVSFDIKKGEFFGIVGRNGSGKSTLLKLLAGIYTPDSGAIHVNGKLTPFIELGVGFNPELTGRENVFLNGALLGFNRKEMLSMYDEIVDFAELHRFMDQKLKNYSSGMQVRLAFSIAIRAKSDILLLDEVLAVGDSVFQKKCYNYFKQLKKLRQTVVFVSHDIAALQEYCDRGILLDGSKLVWDGGIEQVIKKYTELLDETEEKKKRQTSVNLKTKEHIGNGAIIIDEVKLLSPEGRKTKYFKDEDAQINVLVTWKVQENVADPIYGITIFDASGQRIFVTNNLWCNQQVPSAVIGQSVATTWTIPNIFNTGDFTITPAVASSGGNEVLDQVDEAVFFSINKTQKSNAYTNVAHSLKIEAK